MSRRAPNLFTFSALTILLAGLLTPAASAQPGTAPKPAPAAHPTSSQPEAVKQPPVKPPAKSKPTSTDPSAVELADEPSTIDSIGLTFYPPLNAVVQSSSAGGESVLQIVSPDKAHAWQVDIRTPRTTREDITAEGAGKSVLRQLLESVGSKGDGLDAVGTIGKVLDTDPAVIFDPARPDLAAYRVYVSLPRGGKEPDAIRGYTVMKIGPKQFLAFDLSTTADHFTQARRAYETMVASSRLSTGDVAMSRATAVQSGVKAFERLTREDYEAALAVRNDRWERLFIPSATGADTDEKELAYRRIRCRLGTRAELDSNRTAPRAAKPEGYIFQMDARYLDTLRTLDTQSIFFLSFDRNEEVWTIRNAVREKDKVATSTETGARSGRSLTVQTDGTGSARKTIEPKFETDGYISQIESFLLPQLLIRTQLPTDYAFYTYQSAAQRVQIRRDALDQPVDKPGLWKLTTKLSEDSKKTMTSLYQESGELIRTELPDGSIWEPVELDRLVKLWRDKNLPMK